MILKKLILMLILCSTGFSSEITTSFNGGELSPLIEYRLDLDARYSGVETLENMIVKSTGGAIRRPGTKYITALPADVEIGYNAYAPCEEISDCNLTHTVPISTVEDLQKLACWSAGFTGAVGIIAPGETLTYSISGHLFYAYCLFIDYSGGTLWYVRLGSQNMIIGSVVAHGAHTITISATPASGLNDNAYLTNDIDASATINWFAGSSIATGFFPIGGSYAWGGWYNPFTGTLDGCGYTISGLVCDRANSGNQGLFSMLDGATICNLILSDFVITGNGGLGLLAGDVQDVNIQYVTASGDIMTYSLQVGGLIGTGHGDDNFAHCCNVDVNIICSSYIAWMGLFGGILSGTFSDCTASGSIISETGEGWGVGGFISSLGVVSSFTGCAASGTIYPAQKSSSTMTNGGFIGEITLLAGQSYDDITYSNCYFSPYLNYLPFGGTDEAQRLLISNNPTGGYFTVTFDGITTGQVAWNATKADFQSVLDNAYGTSVIDAFLGAPITGQPTYIIFRKQYSRTNVALATVASSLTGPDSPYTITVATTTNSFYPPIDTESEIRKYDPNSYYHITNADKNYRLIPFNCSVGESNIVGLGKGFMGFYKTD